MELTEKQAIRAEAYARAGFSPEEIELLFTPVKKMPIEQRLIALSLKDRAGDFFRDEVTIH